MTLTRWQREANGAPEAVAALNSKMAAPQGVPLEFTS